MPFPPGFSLSCPICTEPLGPAEARAGGPSRLACTSGHSFDAARQGYFNLLVGKGSPFEPDTAAMVDARFTFLGAGHYSPLAREVAAAVVRCLSPEQPAVLDSGTGTGHYLREVLDTAAAQGKAVNAVGIDISKFALRRAARLNPEALNLVWDVWQRFPLDDGSVDAVTVVFAPRNVAEFARVLRPQGRLVVVTPRPGHLSSIAAPTGMLGIEEGKDSRLAAAMSEHFDAESATDVDIPLQLSRREAADLAFMGPAGHHQGRDAIAGRLSGVSEPLATDARFRVLVYRPKVRR